MTKDWVVSVGVASSKFLQSSQLVDLLTRLISWNIVWLWPGSRPLLHGYFFVFHLQTSWMLTEAEGFTRFTQLSELTDDSYGNNGNWAIYRWFIKLQIMGSVSLIGAKQLFDGFIMKRNRISWEICMYSRLDTCA